MSLDPISLKRDYPISNYNLLDDSGNTKPAKLRRCDTKLSHFHSDEISSDLALPIITKQNEILEKNPLLEKKIKKLSEENFQSPAENSLSQEDVNPICPHLKKIFQNLPIPGREVHLIKGNEDFQQKITKENLRIQEQVKEENLSSKASKIFTPLERLEKEIIENVDYCEEIGFITQKSPRHQNEDRLQYITLELGDQLLHGFAIFDGHGGNQASTFCEENISDAFMTCLNGLSIAGEDFEIANAMKMAFVFLDVSFEHYRKENNIPKNPGCTGIFAFFFNKKLFIANAGDCRAILIVDDPTEAEQLSYDYKACQKYAKNSVFKRGGMISLEGTQTYGTMRVDKSLAITRAIGDEHLRRKNGIKSVTPRPKIMMIDLENFEKNKNIKLCLCSDGLTDFMTTNTIANAVCDLSDTKSSIEIAELLLKEARIRGTQDDITIGIIDIKKLITQ